MPSGSFLIPKWRAAGSAPRWFARPATPWSPAQLTGLALWLPGHLTQALWQQNLATTQLTHAAADGDPVGQVDDQGPHAHRAAAGSTGREPVLGSGGGRPSFLTFDGSNDVLVLENSKHALAFVHTTAQFTILAWVKVASDGTNLILLDSANNGASGNVGLFLRRNSSGDTLTFIVVKGVAGTPVMIRTTTATLRVADGWQPVVIKCNGATASIQVGSQAAETFSAVAGAAAGTPSTDDLHIGARSSALGTYFQGSLGDLAVCSGALADSELDLYRRFAPQRSGAPLSRALLGGLSLAPQQLSHYFQHYDFSDATRLFPQIDKTGSVSADATAIGCVEHRGGAALRRDAAAAANDGTRPLYRTAVQNGLAAAEWDGADDRLGFLNWCAGGALTVLLVAKNRDTTLGSHYLQGTQYVVQTGSNYEGGDNERFVVHPIGSPSPAAGSEDGIGSPVAGEAWHVYEFTRDASVWQIAVDGVSGPSVTNSGALVMNNMGQQSISGWWLDGYVGELVKYNVAHSATNRAKVRRHLGTKWNIPISDL